MPCDAVSTSDPDLRTKHGIRTATGKIPGALKSKGQAVKWQPLMLLETAELTEPGAEWLTTWTRLVNAHKPPTAKYL